MREKDDPVRKTLRRIPYFTYWFYPYTLEEPRTRFTGPICKCWKKGLGKQMDYAVNNMTRIVEIAESLHRLKEEDKIL